MSENSMEALLEKMMEQNAAANRLLADVAKQRDESRNREKIAPWVVVAFIAIVFAALQIVTQSNYQKMHKETLDYFSQYEFYESWEITQEQETDGGNNNFFKSEATYNEATKDGEQ